MASEEEQGEKCVVGGMRGPIEEVKAAAAADLAQIRARKHEDGSDVAELEQMIQDTQATIPEAKHGSNQRLQLELDLKHYKMELAELEDRAKVAVTGCMEKEGKTFCRGVDWKAFYTYDTETGEIIQAIPLNKNTNLRWLVGNKFLARLSL